MHVTKVFLSQAIYFKMLQATRILFVTVCMVRLAMLKDARNLPRMHGIVVAHSELFTKLETRHSLPGKGRLRKQAIQY